VTSRNPALRDDIFVAPHEVQRNAGTDGQMGNGIRRLPDGIFGLLCPVIKKKACCPFLEILKILCYIDMPLFCLNPKVPHLSMQQFNNISI
jgi:hypothetical protein